MELNAKQQQGLEIALKRYREGRKFTVISGYAGSGKSTLVRFIIEALTAEGIDPEDDVCYCTFTGKAAQVLLKKGNKNVSTLHKLLYKAYLKKDGTYGYSLKDEIGYRLIVVDEVSMAPAIIMNTLAKFPVHIIALGDPFQLPAINPEDDNHLLDHPHIFLDEIMRQAQESEIIKVSMAIRNMKPLQLFDGKDVKIISKNQLTTSMLKWADQILCATNKTRVMINDTMRQLLGRGEEPEDGDKIIALHNDWNTIADNEDPLVNGTIGYLQNYYSSFMTYPSRIDGIGRFETIEGDFLSDSGALFTGLSMDKKMILTGERCCDSRTEYKLSKCKPPVTAPLAFTYGYCITCHKAQGSEWEKVLVMEERFPFEEVEHARWLYTAVTRASDKLVLVTK